MSLVNHDSPPASLTRLRVGLGALVALAALGCGGPAAGPGGSPDPSSPFGKQVLAVREGRADRIEAASPPTAEEWESLRGLAGLRVFVLQRGVAGETEAAILATLPAVQRLVLRQSPLTDAGFAALSGCRTLRDLNVPQAACTAAGIQQLKALPNLTNLRLGGTNLDGPGLARAIATLPELRSLHLIDVAIGDEGLEALATAAPLENLYLDGAGASEAAWKRYFEARPGVHVHVDQAHHDRDPARGDE